MDTRFRAREFWRMVGLTWPFRRLLITGVLLTIVFAGLHTVSLVGVFPVFKTLLESEGLRGWAERTVAGDRVGLALATPASDAAAMRVIKTHRTAKDLAPGVEENDLLADGRKRSAAELLHDLTVMETGSRVPVLIERRGDQLPLELTTREPELKMRALRWAISFIPPEADVGEGKLRTLAYVLAFLLTVVLIANCFRYWGEVLIAQAVLRGLMGLRNSLYHRTLHMPMSFFAGHPTADLVGRFVQDMQEMQRGMLTLFSKFIREPLSALLILGLALSLDWRLTLTMGVVAPVTITIFWFVGRSVKKANHKLLQGYGSTIDALTAALQNLRIVKAYTAEDHERDRLWTLDNKMFKHQLKLAKMQAFVSPAVESLAICAGSIVTLWLASRVVNQQLELSKFVTLGVVLSMLFDPLRKITDVYVRVQRATAGAERVFQVLDQPVEVDGDPADGDGELQPLAQSIEYRDVSFTYPSANVPALRDVSLSIHKGETVAIVGPNGSGKTTLISLLLRFFDPQVGAILYDGRDLRRARLHSLRSQIGLVTQDAVVFAGTPSENITYGRPGVKEDVVLEAARQAFADEFIRNIPGAYQANLGERGTTLSGGQRQRLAIARAICRNAPVLIFDEATSQIDSESELKIQKAIQEFAKGRTTVIIAHRLSTIQFADRIIVMDQGRVIDSGKHAELFDRCPLYRNLCETQFVTDPGAATGIGSEPRP